jgi:hypothetical protein
MAVVLAVLVPHSAGKRAASAICKAPPAGQN